MSSQDRMTVFPFKPGDWVANASGRVAKVKGVWEGDPGEVLLDLWMYSRRGERTGRESSACGGPRTFEPACTADWWHRIPEPSFPLREKWVPDGKGKLVARLFTGDPLPPANWTPPKRKARPIKIPDDPYRKVLEAIADGHNDARGLAEIALGRR